MEIIEKINLAKEVQSNIARLQIRPPEVASSPGWLPRSDYGLDKEIRLHVVISSPPGNLESRVSKRVIGDAVEAN